MSWQEDWKPKLMTTNLPVFLFLIPFLAAISMPMVGMFRKSLCWPVAVAALSSMSVVSFLAFQHVLLNGPVSYPFSGWTPPLGIEWVLDGLSALVMLLVSFMSLTTVFYGGPGVQKTFNTKIVPIYTLILLLVSALTGMVMAGDLFNLFVFLEVASLSAYALVAVAGGRAMLSSFRFLILGTIGASFYLLGVGYLYAATGTLNMGDLSLRLAPIMESRAVLSGFVFVMIGLAIKMALFPLHGWLPDAYADAPESISPLLASLMTKVALYALVRISFWVLGVETIFEIMPFMIFMGWIGAIATLVGGLFALSEKNIKRMFAYGGISHIGLVVLGLSLGNKTGFTGAIFYLLNDAVMQAGLFFIAGTIIYQYGIKNISDLTQIGGKMPWTITALIVVALSMVGIPPTGGFFGKWYIVLGALEAGNYVAVAVIIISTLLTLAYFLKIMERLILEKRQPSETPGLEAPFPMRVGMGIVVASILLLGIFSDPAIQMIQTIALPSGY